MNKKIIIKLLIESLIVFSLLIGIAFLFYKILDGKHPTVSGYCCNLITEGLGIFITVRIIQSIVNLNNQKQKKEEERIKIKSQFQVSSAVFNLYVRYFYCLITPIEKRNFDNVDFDKGFSVGDLRDLHRTTLLLSDNLKQSALSLFFYYEGVLRNVFIQMLNNIAFDYFNEIRELLLEYINKSVSFTANKAIVGNETIYYENKRASDFYMEMLNEDNIEDLYLEYKSGKLKSNGIIPYFLLYEFLEEERSLLNTINRKIENL